MSAGKFPTLGSVAMTDPVSDQATFFICPHQALVTTLSLFSLSCRHGKWILFPVFINTVCVCSSITPWLMTSYLMLMSQRRPLCPVGPLLAVSMVPTHCSYSVQLTYSHTLQSYLPSTFKASKEDKLNIKSKKRPLSHTKHSVLRLYFCSTQDQT